METILRLYSAGSKEIKPKIGTTTKKSTAPVGN